VTDFGISASEEELLSRADSARRNAYVPYSSFSVGAALRTRDGVIIEGCNVENISLGLTMCAERVALGAAVVHGCTEIETLALVSDSGEPVVPCGACRQVLAEFNPKLRIVSRTVRGATAIFALEELLPKPQQGILA